jgi:hypothetical protein
MHAQFGDRIYWNTRAETMRVLAEDVGDPQAKTTLLKVADSYQRLANQADHQGDRLTDLQKGSINNGTARGAAPGGLAKVHGE